MKNIRAKAANKVQDTIDDVHKKVESVKLDAKYANRKAKRSIKQTGENIKTNLKNL